MKRRQGATRSRTWIPILATAGILLGASLGGCGIEPGEQEQPAARTPQVQPPPRASQLPIVPQVQEQPAELAVQDTAGTETPETSVPTPVSFADAEAAYHEKRYAEAVDLFEAYAEQKPANPWGLYMLGLSAWKAGQLEIAGHAFEEALRLDPKHDKSLLNWSRVLLETQQPEEAVARIETVLEMNPESNDAYRLLGRARDVLGETEAAIQAYKHALVLDDEDAWSMNNLAFLMIRQGREADALPALARAVQLRADVAVFQNNLGVALERTGHAAAAAQAFRDALAADSTYEKAAISLARVEALQPESSVEPSLLADLAQGFAVEIEGWRQSFLSQTQPPADDEDATQIIDAAVTRRLDSLQPQE